MKELRKRKVSFPRVMHECPADSKLVMNAYSLALRNTFWTGAVLGLVMACLILTLRLPRLDSQVHRESKEGNDDCGTA